jgi:uncharacterized membrane protein
MLGTGFTVVAALLVAAGLALGVVGGLGWRRRLPRNRFAGVRTVNTLRDDETFAVGNQVGAPLSIAAGAVAFLGGLVILAAHSTTEAGVLAVLTTVGTLGLTVAGGVLGDRAAGRVPMPTMGCSGVCACCSLADGCGGAEGQASPAGGTDMQVSSDG